MENAASKEMTLLLSLSLETGPFLFCVPLLPIYTTEYTILTRKATKIGDERRLQKQLSEGEEAEELASP